MRVVREVWCGGSANQGLQCIPVAVGRRVWGSREEEGEGMSLIKQVREGMPARLSEESSL